MAGKGETEIYGCACGHHQQRGERTDSTSWYSFQTATAPFPGVLFLMTVAYSIKLFVGWRFWPCWFQALQKFSDFKAGQVLPLLITSYELLRKHMDKIASAEPGLLICDEAHRLKNWYYKQPNVSLLYVDFFDWHGNKPDNIINVFFSCFFWSINKILMDKFYIAVTSILLFQSLFIIAGKWFTC